MNERQQENIETFPIKRQRVIRELPSTHFKNLLQQHLNRNRIEVIWEATQKTWDNLLTLTLYQIKMELKTFNLNKLWKDMYIRDYQNLYNNFSDSQKNNYDKVELCFMSHYLSQPDALDFASPSGQQDLQILAAYGEFQPETRKWQYNINTLTRYITNQPARIKLVSKYVLNNYKMMLAAIKIDGNCIKRAPEEIRNNIKFVWEAISQDGHALKYVPMQFRNNVEFFLKAFSSYGLALKHVSAEMQDNQQIVLLSVGRHGPALEYASNRMKNTFEVVLRAVSKHGGALKYASEQLKDNEQLVFLSISDSGYYIRYASTRLRDSKDVVSRAVSKNGEALQYASTRLKNTREIVFLAVSQEGTALKFASKIMQEDKKIVKCAVSQNGAALEYASDDLKNNLRIVIAAVRNKPGAIQFAAIDLQTDPRVIIVAIAKNRCIINTIKRTEYNLDIIARASRLTLQERKNILSCSELIATDDITIDQALGLSAHELAELNACHDLDRKKLWVQNNFGEKMESYCSMF